MTGFDYAGARATAERLIKRFGQPGKLRRVTATGPDYDPEQTVEDYACLLVALDYDQQFVDNTLILSGDRMVYLSTQDLAVTPDLSDRLVIDGAEHAVISITSLSPAGTVVFWQIQARGQA
ncbi:MAG: hypothetical protein KGI75_30020 [Rhizobiaceae bacterium]|nr:hypothetical protein [Rhizobiaceae bacterium]